MIQAVDPGSSVLLGLLVFSKELPSQVAPSSGAQLSPLLTPTCSIDGCTAEPIVNDHLQHWPGLDSGLSASFVLLVRSPFKTVACLQGQAGP